MPVLGRDEVIGILADAAGGDVARAYDRRGGYVQFVHLNAVERDGSGPVPGYVRETGLGQLSHCAYHGCRGWQVIVGGGVRLLTR